jgi:peptide/nickel transport system substrate-binding protein
LVVRPLAAAGALLAMVALGGCLGNDERRGSALEGGTASVALGDAPVALDPASHSGPASPGPLWLVYTPPLTYRRVEGREGTELIPGVARALPVVSGDGTTYSLRVRRGLRFSNGRPVRARDVRHTILRSAALGAVGRRLFAGVTGIEADDRTGAVRIHLWPPDSSFPHALAAAQAGVVPDGTPAPDAGRRPPPGVGPYRIGRSRPDGGFVLLRNRDFRLPGVPAGLIDAFRLRPAGTPSEQAQAVIAGRLDVMTDPPPVGLLPELRSELRDRYSEHPDLATRYLSIRAGREPLQRPELRRALAYGFDKPEAARRLAGLAQPTCNLLPPSLPGHDEPDPCPWGDPAEHPDLVRARELVEEAGEQGTLVTVAASARDRPIARLYAGTLRKIGLRPVLLNGGRADVTVSVARSLVADPARFLGPLAVRVPLAEDPRALLLADELASAVDPDDAARLASELDRRLVETGVLVPYAGVSRTLFVSARIDAANCVRVHPVYGVDLSSLCVR